MPARLVIIDTQSVLDWLVFRNPICAAWHERLGSGEWKWVFTDSMRAEFDHTARRGFGPRWPVDAERSARAWTSLGHRLATPAVPTPAASPLRCTDPDDQMFIDLALAAPADTLVTRDRALLRLARRAAARGTRICLPQAW